METRICAVYDEHEGRYGYRRIMAALCNSMDEPVNHKCVQRLMQKMGLRALIRAKNRSRYVTGQTDVHVPNVLGRDFCATASNQKWANDFTEFNVNGQKLYLRPAWTFTTERSSRIPWHGAPSLSWFAVRCRQHFPGTSAAPNLLCTLIRVGTTRCSPIEQCSSSVGCSKV